MASLPGRIYKLAQSYLDTARNRLADIDPAAEEELRRALPHESSDYAGGNPGGLPAPSTLSAMERARNKINAAQQQVAAKRQLQPEHYNFSAHAQPTDTAPIVEPDVTTTAYRIIGVPEGSPFPIVEKAVLKLRERCAPERFPEGSSEREEATQILKRIDDAFRVLRGALGVPESRFDKLEF